MPRTVPRAQWAVAIPHTRVRQQHASIRPSNRVRVTTAFGTTQGFIRNVETEINWNQRILKGPATVLAFLVLGRAVTFRQGAGALWRNIHEQHDCNPEVSARAALAINPLTQFSARLEVWHELLRHKHVLANLGIPACAWRAAIQVEAAKPADLCALTLGRSHFAETGRR